MRPRHALLFALRLVLALATWTGCADNGVAAGTAEQAAQPQPTVALPNKDGSFKFGVLGDFGTGEKVQYELADQMNKLHQRFNYELVVLVGDNLYGSERPQDFQTKFELPYKPLLDAG